MNATPSHDNDWTVRTLKEHFDALRTEDQRAIFVLSRDITARLDRVSIGFEELKATVDKFHAALEGGMLKSKSDYGVIINVLTLIVALGLLAATFLSHH
jgi:hypothetical protein